jgi:hypothetical protein
MTTKKAAPVRKNGHGNGELALAMRHPTVAQAHLQEQLAQLAQLHATMLEAQATHQRDMAALRHQMDDRQRATDLKFEAIMQILHEHSRILAGLPDAVRDKIGFASR